VPASRSQEEPLRFASFEVPGGDLSVVVDGRVVVASTFRGVPDALDRLADRRDAVPDPLPWLGAVLRRYREGELAALDEVAVRQPGGTFQQQAWAAMRGIAPGTVRTYGGLAESAGRPRAYRAAGTACSSNLVAPFVPCHRVVASNGIGGYGYGLHVKRALLEHEGVPLA
jgi:methylated-DNA-[protein]-cysteine S-methyltransferase